MDTKINTTKKYKYATDDLFIWADTIINESWQVNPILPQLDRVNSSSMWEKFKEEVLLFWKYNIFDSIHNIRGIWNRFWQRRFRGWDDSDIWSVAYTTSKFLVPRLERFAKKTCSVPMDLCKYDKSESGGDDKSLEKWQEVILEIAWYHKVICDQDDWDHRQSSFYLTGIFLKNPKNKLGRVLTKEEKEKIPLVEKAYKELNSEYNKAEKLFRKYYTDLWW